MLLDGDKQKNIAVIGPNTDSNVALLGNYHDYYGTAFAVLEGLENALPDARITRARGCHLWEDSAEDPGYLGDANSEAVAVAHLVQVVVLYVSLGEIIEGEEMGKTGETWTGDKGDLLLSKAQQLLL